MTSSSSQSNLPPRPRSATVERRRALFDEALRLIEREHHRGLLLDDVARRLATSRRQLQRVLADIGATRFRDLVLSVRMRHAQEALRKSAASVREIARGLGYNEASDFSKAFRRYHGISPSQYRERLGGELTSPASRGEESEGKAPTKPRSSGA